MKMDQSVPKRRHKKFRRRGITEKKEYNNIQGADYTSGKLQSKNAEAVKSRLQILYQ